MPSSSSADPNTADHTMPKLNLPPLTLIVATTPISHPTNQATRKLRLGIGHNGTLPWPRIKADMGFFARVTTRPPPSTSIPTPSEPRQAINAVIMGRKTYDSLPTRFRPLPKRLNVIITRDTSGALEERAIAEWKASKRREREKAKAATATTTQEDMRASEIDDDGDGDGEYYGDPEILVSNSPEAAMRTLQEEFTTRFSNKGARDLGNIYVIGGGEIYASALRSSSENSNSKMRIVMTDVRRNGSGPSGTDPVEMVDGFECDTFFPIDELDGNAEWRKASTEEVEQWVGEKVSGGWVWQGNIAMRMVGYERV